MNRHRSLLLLAVAASLLLGGCGGKRPPVLSTAQPGQTGSATRPPTQRVDSGPDVQPAGDEGPRGQDFSAADASGEGGPLADIQFEYDRATLSDAARGILEKHALWLQSHREVRVRVEGHCDERGTVDYNLALGEQRARAARDYLASLGVAADRLSTVSYGKERPLDPGNNDAAWARNRRDHFAVAR
ncbi:MAG TPA: peptidoglycan-associated lipoprotein Pal [Vicinamibacteria bacterium]|jgi:peptidoglycan-associated lipoprotein|nr:peptidoglycan-associated lipoprotein Pal [Vicinamibacteria bacterium]